MAFYKIFIFALFIVACDDFMFDAQKFIDGAVEDLKRRITGTRSSVFRVGLIRRCPRSWSTKLSVRDLRCVLVDTGYMRKNEIENNEKLLEGLGLNVLVVDAKDRFIGRIEGRR